MNANANPSPDKPSGNKTPYIIGALILLAGLFAFWWFGRNSEESDNSHSTVADTTIVSENNDEEKCKEEYPSGSVVGLAITGDSLIRLYQENSRLKAELAACLGNGPQKATTKTGTTTTRTTTRKTTKKSAPTSSSKTETRETVPAQKPTSSNVTGANLAITLYKPVITGDQCITFDDNSYLIYCIRKSILDAIPGLSWPSPNVNNQFRDVYESNGYYIATSNTIVDVNMLLNKISFNFAWYAGMHENGYEIWLPHELHKEIITPYYPHAYDDPALVQALKPYKVRPNKAATIETRGYEYFGFTINYEPK